MEKIEGRQRSESQPNSDITNLLFTLSSFLFLCPVGSPLYFYLTMPSPLPPYQLSSSHSSSAASTRPLQHQKSSSEKPGFVHRTSSSSSLHRAASNKSNSSTGPSSKLASKHHHHHAHVAHTFASKHHRTTSFGHRVPSYGKGLNKLTALTTVNADDGPKEHLSIHSLVDRAGTSMQRSLSEGTGFSPKLLGWKLTFMF